MSNFLSHAEAARLEKVKPVLELRGRMMQGLRAWFAREGFLEVDTPVRVATPAMEVHIDALASGNGYLRTSPELHLKRLLAAGYDKIYQAGPCFRDGERGDRHHPEFTMLEWYRTGTDYRGILEDTRRLLPFLAQQLFRHSRLTYQGRDIDLADDWVVYTVQEVFLSHAGWDPLAHFDADRFNEDLVEKVEPALPLHRPVVLQDFPAPLAALARLKPEDPRVAERWELYLGGLEIANAYSELTDASEQRRRFADWAKLRQEAGRVVYAVDEGFMAALEHGMPACGGIALGLDRLLMVLADVDSLDEVLPFREEARGSVVVRQGP